MLMLRGSTPPRFHPPLPPSIHLFVSPSFLSISHPLHFTGAALERGRERQRGGGMRGKEGCITGWSNVISRFLCHPSILFKLPTTLKNKAKNGRMKTEEEGGSVFPSLFNNGGMISAYPLITALLFSSPPLSLAPRKPPILLIW